MTLRAAISAVALSLSGCGDPPPPVVTSESLARASKTWLTQTATGDIATDPTDAVGPVDTLRPRRTIVDPAGFRRLRHLRVVGDLLVVTDQLQSPHISVFDRRDGSLVERIGLHGRDGARMVDPSWVIPVADEPPEAWVFDYQRQRLHFVRFGVDPDSTISETILLAGDGWLTEPIWTTGRLISNGLFSDHTLSVLDRFGKTTKRIAATPPFSAEEYEDAFGRMSLNQNFLAARPGEREFALAYYNVNRIDFFFASGVRYASVRGPQPTATYFSNSNGRLVFEDSAMSAYWDVDATSRYIYALFCGCPKTRNRERPRIVHVFDWNGRFVRQLVFDRPVLKIALAGDSLVYAGFEATLPEVGEFTVPSPRRRR
jgi:hypothetical protein